MATGIRTTMVTQIQLYVGVVGRCRFAVNEGDTLLLKILIDLHKFDDFIHVHSIPLDVEFETVFFSFVLDLATC